MGNGSYSLYQRVPDGQLTGPRFLLHLVKLATHAAVAFLVCCLARVFTHGDAPAMLIGSMIGGPGVYAIIVMRQLYLDHRDHVAVNWWDKIHDACFPIATMAGAWLYVGDTVHGLIDLAVAVALWVTLHTRAEP